MIESGEKILVISCHESSGAPCDALAEAGHDVVVVETEDDAVARFRADAAITIVVVGSPPIATVEEFVGGLYEVGREGLVILAHGPAEQREEFRSQGLRMFLTQPWTVDDLQTAVRGRRLTMGLANLHDALWNADLAKRWMESSPIPDADPDTLHACDRFRAERLWVALLAVLAESWHSSMMRPVRDYVASVVDTTALVQTLREARKKPKAENMFEVRHYMFHRDERHYWNQGRLAVVGQLDFYTRLHNEFSTVILSAMHRRTSDSRDAVRIGQGEVSEAEAR